MKKLTWMAALLLVMLGALALPASAQDDAHSLAQYFADDTPFYLEFRTDDEFIQTLDSLVARLSEVLPDSQISASLTEMIDEGIADMVPKGSLEETIRPWLGDEAAFGVSEFDLNNMGNSADAFTVAISITDQAKAEEFFALNPDAEDYTSEAGDGYTVYSPNDRAGDDPYFIFRSDVLVVTGSKAIAEAGGIVEAPLSANAAFDTALSLLPEASYNAAAYIDTPAFLDAIIEDSGDFGMAELAMIEPFMAAIQPQAFGFTVLDERSVVLDFATPYTQGEGLPFVMGTSTPIDPAFAHHIPANTPLVIHGANLYSSFEAGTANLRAFAGMMGDDNEDLNGDQLQMVLFGINFAVRGLTGLETEEALGWMTGDYAFAVGLTPAFADASNIMAAVDELPIDFALILEITDSAAAQNLFTGLSNSLGDLDLDTVSVEAMSDAIHVTLTPEESPFPIELVIAHNEDVFVIGTERMVREALAPQNGLENDTTFTAAGGYFLDGSNMALYLGADGLNPLARVMTHTSNPSNVQEDGEGLEMALGLFDSVSISTAMLPENSGALARLVWTLPE